MEKICPDAWLIQVGNPFLTADRLIDARDEHFKVCGPVHGHYGYLEIASTLGLDPEPRRVARLPGLNHNIWLTALPLPRAVPIR